MSSYIGRSSDGFGILRKYRWVASGNETSIAPTLADSNGKLLRFSDKNLVHLFLNGVKLDQTDFNLNTTNQISGLAALATNDVLEAHVYDVFSIATTDTVSATDGGTFTGATTHSGGITSTTGTFSGAISGTLGTAAQPNVTSVGTLTGLTTAGATISTGNPQLFLASTGDGGEGSINFKDDEGNVDGKIAYRTDYAGNTDNYMTFNTNGSNERMRIDSNGKVGIGGTPPATDHSSMKGIHAGDQAFYGEYDGGSGYITKNRYYSQSNGWTAKETGVGCAINMDTAGALHFQYSASANAAASGLSFTSIASIQNDYAIFKQTRNSVSQYFQNLHASDPYGVAITFVNDSPNNTTNWFLSCADNSSQNFIVFSNGTVKNDTGVYTSFSDERLKTNIVDAKSQWEDIKALNFKNFIKFGNPDLKQLGLIAQDVEKTSPSLVFETPPDKFEIKHNSAFGTLYEDGDELPEGKEVGDVKEVKSNVKNVKDSILYMKSVKALQEAMARIETLEAKVKALENA